MKGARLIARVWSEQPGDFFCISTKSLDGRWRDHWFTRGDFGDLAEFVREHLNESTYFCPHGFLKDRRLKKYAVEGRFLFADLDAADPRKLRWRPTVAIESSPRRYVGLWQLDKIAKEHTNRRLTYATGADPGGWDLTQVLRMPSSRNHKYPSAPKVRVLWDDGPEYELRALKRELPKVGRVPHGTADIGELDPEAHDWKRVLRKYKLAVRLYQHVTRKLPDSSGKVHALACELVEAGASKDEVACVVWASRNFEKFRKRIDARAQLRREVAKAWSKRK